LYCRALATAPTTLATTRATTPIRIVASIFKTAIGVEKKMEKVEVEGSKQHRLEGNR
jgi:hypothetical protein